MSEGHNLPGPGPGHDNCPGGNGSMGRAPGARLGATALHASASSQAAIANVFRPPRPYTEQSSQPRPQRWNNVVLSSSTLEPISQHSLHLANLSVPQEIPSLPRLTLEPASSAGVYGWGPPSGPIRCKFFVLLRHVSQLAVAVLDSQHSKLRFSINFGGKKVPCVSHKFYFANQRYTEFGEDREVLLALVPESSARAVDLFLYVETDRGVMKFNLPLGKFKYDDQGYSSPQDDLLEDILNVVPLKRYRKEKLSMEDLVTFLERGRPEDEDVRVPKIFLASELIGDLLPHHKIIPQPSNHPEAIPSDRPKKRSKPVKRSTSTLSSAPTSNTPSGPTNQPSPDPSPNSKGQKSSTPRSQVRRRHVTIHFADPLPSALAWPSLVVPWTSEETATRRRLVAFSCTTNHSNASATFHSAAVATAQFCPEKSQLVSCIYVPTGCNKLSDTCIITSFDFVNLVKWMIGDPDKFKIDERNRVRRNIEMFKPVTLQKGEHTESTWDLFSQIMGYSNPRPWNISKTFKVFKWHHVEDMMREIVKRYNIVGGEHIEISDEDDFGEQLERAKADLMRDMSQAANMSPGREQVEHPQSQHSNEGAHGSLGQPGVGTYFDTTSFGGQTNIGEVGGNFSFTVEHALSAGSAQMPMDQSRWEDLNKSAQGSLGQAGVGTYFDTTDFGGQTNIGDAGGNYNFTAGHALSAGSAQVPLDEPWFSQSSLSQVSQGAGGLDGTFQDLGLMEYNNNSPFGNSSFLDEGGSTGQALYSFTNQDSSGAGINEAQPTDSGIQQWQTSHNLLSQMTYARTDNSITTQHAQPGHPHQWAQENATQGLAYDIHSNSKAEDFAAGELAAEDFLLEDFPEEEPKD